MEYFAPQDRDVLAISNVLVVVVGSEVGLGFGTKTAFDVGPGLTEMGLMVVDGRVVKSQLAVAPLDEERAA